MDMHGDGPTQTKCLTVHLFRKPAGGRRPIGFYRALQRLATARHKADLRSWDQGRGFCGAFNVGKRRVCSDPVWRNGIKAAANAAAQKAVLAALWDLQKCYEHVRRQQVIEEAYEAEYPLVALRLSMASYLWKRIIVVDGLACEPLYAGRGIVAGSMGALFELKALMLRRVREHVKQVRERKTCEMSEGARERENMSSE